ncbi:MAG: phosphate signaling complex protein PhoU [Gammaproteobacteria bacterium]|nr:phosphate signaling complex protein PhoU [Gammaproteobacteria bacterium]
MARAVISRDKQIDDREVELEEECLKLLALHQPVAADLRLIVAVLKINNDLERIGDHAVNIAERAEQLAGLKRVPVPDEIVELSKQAKLMLRKCLLAFVETDADIAKGVIGTDDLVDELNKRLYDELINRIRRQPDNVEQAVFMLSVCRQLERIGDHACNIAEDVLYLLTGDIVRHSGTEDSVSRARVTPLRPQAASPKLPVGDGKH